MFDVSIDKKYIVTDVGTSDGTQIKYFYNNHWYKLDRYGGEGVAEYIGSIIETNSSLKENEFVHYEYGLVNGYNACRSCNFLESENDSYISIYRLYFNHYGKNISEVIATMDLEKRVNYVLDFVSDSTGLDIRRYLANMFCLDRIMLNEDRHFNNIGLIVSDNGFSEAPIFDNGKSLLVGNFSYTRFDSLSEKVKKVIARPFSGSHDWQYNFFKKYADITFDKGKILEQLKEMKQTQETEIAIYQVERLM